MPDITRYVNPFVGTGGHGHTFPGAVMPFGMVQLSPDTRVDGSWDGCSGYHYSDSVIYGFSHTHLSGTGVSDYGDILLMPTINNIVMQPVYNGDYKVGYASAFSHKNEKASPGYYSVELDDDDIRVELTATARVGFHHYHYERGYMKNIILDLNHRDKVLDSYFHVLDSYTVVGYRRSQAWAQNQVVYFAMKFSEPIKMFGYSINDTVLYNETFIVTEVHGKNLKAAFGFDPANSKDMLVKVAISQTGTDGAMKNLEAELPGWDFEKVKADAQAAWSKELSKIEVSTSNEEHKKIFYTALYHCMIHPSLANDVDGKYLGRDFKVHQLEPGHDYYTVFSLWDTYRALHPLLTIIDQKRTADFINTFLLEYEQGGRLPVWELSSNETECMIGYHSVSVITDAAMKGIRFDYKKALEAMKHSAELDDRGLKAYKDRGYISMEDEGESVSKTLEYAYDDWCISQLAYKIYNSSLNSDEQKEYWSIFIEYNHRGQYWKNIFDWKRGFMRPKKNGGWYSPFNPFEVNGNYTEANAWQYLFAAPQDIYDLISMMGGAEKFDAKLDSLFSVSSQTEGREQSDISGMIGQYAQGNEPSHHMAYLYDYCGVPWKTQERVRQIMTMYTDATDGLIGNEDCGQMSAWYVMSAMGLYEVTPASPYYAIGSPLFTEVKIHLENQKIFTLIAKNNSLDNKYIQSITENGKSIEDAGYFWPHSIILNGDSLIFEMGSNPKVNSNFKIAPFMQSSLIIDPVIQSYSNSFSDQMNVTMLSYSPRLKIYFTRDGSEPNPASEQYSTPFTINSSQTIKAIAVDDHGFQSKVVTATFRKTSKNYKVTYLTNYNSQYAGSGNMTLADEESGTKDFRNGQWQGWWGDDMELIVDLGKETLISKVGAEFLQDQSPWIFFPKAFEVMFSSDGTNFHDNANSVTSSNLLSKNESVQVTTLQIPVIRIKARYIKIIAHNYGKLPSWHVSAGENAWVFCDEIFVE
ncbi:MAG TPA: GH92 family glycosyl hydrolase [Chitinophagales bacterium]|nr:GH92 family glycosyl hydrolase [Chitinophagales bacterium]